MTTRQSVRAAVLLSNMLMVVLFGFTGLAAIAIALIIKGSVSGLIAFFFVAWGCHLISQIKNKDRGLIVGAIMCFANLMVCLVCFFTGDIEALYAILAVDLAAYFWA